MKPLKESLAELLDAKDAKLIREAIVFLIAQCSERQKGMPYGWWVKTLDYKHDLERLENLFMAVHRIIEEKEWEESRNSYETV